MKISPSLHLSARELPVEQLAKNSTLPNAEKIGALCQQFEAVLLRQVLTNARKTVIDSKLHPPSAANGIYDDMVTQRLAEGMSQSGALIRGNTLKNHMPPQPLKAPAALPGGAQPISSDSK